MARRKRHYTVMRALLDGFSERGQVIARSRQGQEFPQAIRSATVVADFYSLDNEGSPDDAVEKWLASMVESDFARILPSLRRGEQPTAEMRPAIARFLATSVVRTRTARSYLAQIDHHAAGTVVLSRSPPSWDGIWPRWVGPRSSAFVTYASGHGSPCPQDQTKRPAPARHGSAVARDRATPTEVRVVGVKNPKPGSPYRRCDAPVLALCGHTSGWHGLVPIGAAVFMPLSPQTLLVGEPHAFKRSSASDTGLVTSINALTTREAYQYVFRHPKMPWPMELRLASQPLSLPKPTFSVTRSAPDSSTTFPFTYPEMDDAETATLLKRLNAVEVVE